MRKGIEVALLSEVPSARAKEGVQSLQKLVSRHGGGVRFAPPPFLFKFHLTVGIFFVKFNVWNTQRKKFSWYVSWNSSLRENFRWIN